MASQPNDLGFKPGDKAIDRIAGLSDVISEGGDEAQKMRRVPDETIKALVDAGFFRFTLPPELGGENASVRETIEILEAISAIDGSVGWNVMLGSEINAMAAGGMPADIAKEVYVDNPGVIMCGGGGPGTVPSRAEPQADGGMRVWGQTTFISGCHNAEWCFMAAPVIVDGEMQNLPDGSPYFKMWFLNRSEWEILDTWDVAGLRGSGSHDVVADGAYVPERHVPVDLMVTPPLYDNPVYRIPVALRLAYNKAAVALGVAKGALDTFSDLAQNKIPMLSSSTLKHRPIAQYRMGEATAGLRSVRAYVMEAMDEVEAELNNGLASPSAAATQNARLACTHAANVCMSVVDSIHNTAGTSGMRSYSPLERKVRDAKGCATHRWVAHPLYEDLGAILLGNEPGPEFDGSGAQPGPR
jgi:alkylation response protein AidB-like acyl-CoA dehydrogenase